MDYKFEKLINVTDNKTIIVYGTGINAQKIWGALYGANILGVIDYTQITGWFEGKKILSFKEALILKPEAIVIAAQPSSTLLIYHRIISSCDKNHIVLYDLYGNNLKELLANIEEQQLNSRVGNCKAIKMQIDMHEIISFDVFDTLIMRNTLYPSDVFYLVEQKAKKRGIKVTDFVKNRILAEQSLCCNSPNIYEIYDAYQKNCNITDEQKLILLNIEILVETDVLVRREAMVEVFDYAIQSGKNVYLISDMYLPKEILKKILDSLKITGYRDLIVSCDYHQTKFTYLYKKFMEKYSALSYLHIGDNLEADCFCAKSIGMDVCLVNSAYTLFKKSTYHHVLKKVQTLNERSILGLFIAKIFNSPFSLDTQDCRPCINNITEFCYLFFAPVILKLSLWIIECLSEDSYDKILFSSRDGFLLLKLYNLLKIYLEHENLPNGIYFYASRVLCSRAGIRNQSDIEWVLSAPYTKSERDIVIERFDLEHLCLPDYDISSYDSATEFAFMHEKLIYEHSNEIKSNYLKYMNMLGLNENGKYAFFDFVSCGTCQYFLSKYVPFSLQGLYCGYYDSLTGGKRELPIKALFMNKDYFNKETVFFKNYLLFECVITSNESSVINMSKDGKPRFDIESRNQLQMNMIKSTQDAIISYIEKYISTLYVEGISIDKSFVDDIFGLMSLEYTDSKCKELDNMELLDDFGKNVIPLKR